MKTIKNQPYSWIAVNGKNRLPSTRNNSSDNYFLNDKDQFSIEIFNPTKKTYKVVIKIQGDVVTSNGLVVKNGQRVWLDCNIDTRKQFVFNTYNVDNSPEAQEAISDNGKIEILYYEEKTQVQPIQLINDGWSQDYRSSFYINNTKLNDDTRWHYGLNKVTCRSSDFDIFRSSNLSLDSIETGKIETGELSNQEFEYVTYDFEVLPKYTQSISILPTSAKLINKIPQVTLGGSSFINPPQVKIPKKVETEHIEQKDDGGFTYYCTNCGQAYYSLDKFCKYCGNKH